MHGVSLAYFILRLIFQTDVNNVKQIAQVRHQTCTHVKPHTQLVIKEHALSAANLLGFSEYMLYSLTSFRLLHADSEVVTEGLLPGSTAAGWCKAACPMT